MSADQPVELIDDKVQVEQPVAASNIQAHSSPTAKDSATSSSNTASPDPTGQPPALTQRKTNSALTALLELHDRYVPDYSTAKDITYKDPRKFSLKPPCWEKWTQEDYSKTAEFLQALNYEQLGFELGKPVEEVRHVLNALLVGPLYDFQRASCRGARGIRSLFELYNEHGTPMRLWTDKEILGELDGVTDQKVHLILDNGDKGSVGKEDLTERDLLYLEDHSFPATPKATPDWRLWTDEYIEAAFTDIALHTVFVTTRTGSKISVPKAHLNSADKTWLNGHVSKVLVREFTGAAPSENSATAEGEVMKYRRWTARRVIAKLYDVSEGKIHLKCGDGTKITVSPLTPTDRELFNNQLTSEIKKKLGRAGKSSAKSKAEATTAAEPGPGPATAAFTTPLTPKTTAAPAISQNRPSIRSSPAVTETRMPETPTAALSQSAPLTPAPTTGKVAPLAHNTNRLDPTSPSKRKRDREDDQGDATEVEQPSPSKKAKDRESDTPVRLAGTDEGDKLGEKKIRTDIKANVLRRWGLSCTVG